jgi:hypothetical protein
MEGSNPNKPFSGPGGRGSHADNQDSEYSGRDSTSGQMDAGRFGSWQFADNDLAASGKYGQLPTTVGDGSRAGIQFQGFF